jgi:hypothetical protein
MTAVTYLGKVFCVKKEAIRINDVTVFDDLR